jgi:ABC-type Fe3+ transport system permease subunit
MNPQDQALLLLALPGIVIAIAAMLSARRLDQYEREIAARKAAGHPAE